MLPRSAIAAFLPALLLLLVRPAATAAELPIFDAHIHYSHDSRDVLPPKTAIEILRKSGVRRALVSSSNDEGTQALVAEAPDLIRQLADDPSFPRMRKSRRNVVTGSPPPRG